MGGNQFILIELLCMSQKTKIQRLTLRNFRSFKGKHQISLGKKGKNLLVYGENGSGKSSICTAIDIFFQAEDQRRKLNLRERHANIFSTEKGKDRVAISLKFTPPFQEIILNNTGYSNISEDQKNLLNGARKYKVFLTYRDLLKTFIGDSDSINLFDLFVNGVFAYTRNPETKRQVKLQWEELKKINNKSIKADLKLFGEGLSKMVSELTWFINQILRYFDDQIKVEFELNMPKLLKADQLSRGRIGLKIEYHGRRIRNITSFFNEARLSALSIAIYFASFLQHEEDEGYNKALKILLLDDVFVGIDSSNRLPFLEVSG